MATILTGVAIGAVILGGLLVFAVSVVLGARGHRAENQPDREPYQESVFQRRLQDPDATQRIPAITSNEER